MAETGENVPHEGQQQQQHQQQENAHRDDICRDFLKNICNRGSRCKFYHPPDAQREQSESDINFCLDYQNRGCRRDNCRFVHAPRDEVDRYKQTRELTLILARAVAAVSNGDTIGGIPICKEFQTGRCARGATRCRYWHVNVEIERDRRLRGLPPSNDFMRFPDMPPMGGNGRRRGPPDACYEYDEMPKRMRVDSSGDRVMELEKRNAELLKEVDSLKRELQREHERYEDLYALFRQQSGGAPAPAKPAAAPGGGTEYYSASWGTSTGW